MAAKLNRGERILLALLGGVVVVAALYWVAVPYLTTAIENRRAATHAENAKQQLDSLVQTVVPGDTVVLENPEDAVFVSWDGALEVTLENVALFPTLEKAAASQELGEMYYKEPLIIGGYPENPSDYSYLVVTLRLANIDAVPYDDPKVPGSFNATIFHCTYATPEFPWNLAGFASMNGGIAASDEETASKFYLAQGEDTTLTFGFWILDDVTEATIAPSIGGTAPVTFQLITDGAVVTGR